jgi:hypothetical protein
MAQQIVIGIDPDVTANGVACVDVAARSVKATTMPFPDLLDYLRSTKREADTQGRPLHVIIEAGWLNRSNWHLLCRDSKAAAAAKGNHVGRNHETGRKIAEMCEHWQIPFSLVRPLPLTARGGIKLWRGKGGKITQEEIIRILPLRNRTNQEGRDAALLAWTWAGLPLSAE